jgi:hypothetical protein
LFVLGFALLLVLIENQTDTQLCCDGGEVASPGESSNSEEPSTWEERSPNTEMMKEDDEVEEEVLEESTAMNCDMELSPNGQGISSVSTSTTTVPFHNDNSFISSPPDITELFQVSRSTSPKKNKHKRRASN